MMPPTVKALPPLPPLPLTISAKTAAEFDPELATDPLPRSDMVPGATPGEPRVDERVALAFVPGAPFAPVRENETPELLTVRILATNSLEILRGGCPAGTRLWYRIPSVPAAGVMVGGLRFWIKKFLTEAGRFCGGTFGERIMPAD